MKQFQAYFELMRFDKPIGIYLLLWPTLLALWFATPLRYPSISLVLIFTLGVIFTRAAGCIINDIADRDIDGHVTRTKNRPLADGRLSVNQALAAFGLVLCLAASLLLFLPIICFKLALAAMVLILFYPFSKRVFRAPQLILGIAFNWGILMAVAATYNTLPGWAWLLFLAFMLEVVCYDTYYAMMDMQDDLLLPIHSLAITLGRFQGPFFAICYLVSWSLLLYLGNMHEVTALYYIGLLVHVVLLSYYWWLIFVIKKQCFRKAFTAHHLASLSLLLGLIATKL